MDALFSAIEIAQQEEAQKPKDTPHPASVYQSRFRISATGVRPSTPENQTQKRAASQSPQKPKPKRGPGSRGGRIPGRGRGRGGHNATGRLKEPVPETPPNDQTFLNHHWTNDELNALFVYLFGSENDVTYNKWVKNKERVYKKFLENHFDIKVKFNNNHEAVAGVVTRNTAVYSYIKEYETFTGGGSDADLQSCVEDSDEWHERRIVLAKKGGKALGTLNVKKYRLWMQLGWYDLFNNRFGKSAKVDRVVVRNSVAELSPLAQRTKDLSEPESDEIPWSDTPSPTHAKPNTTTQETHSISSDEDIVPTPKPAVTPAPKGRKKSQATPRSSAVVSEPRHQSATKSNAKNFKSQATGSLESIGTMFDMRRQNMRVKSLREILETPNLPEETYTTVNAKLLEIISEI
ncbi:hypothetical protein F5880DRAFT_1582766 [Lentinula raphanica]|nr:hypothetical protein F5880DRAFT_1582766 [Lentinula raphanica]